MIVDTFAKQLGFDLKTEGALAKDEKGSYHLTLSEIPVEIAPLEQGFALRTAIGPCPTRESNEEFFVTVMLANLMGQGTGGAVLSLDASGSQLQMARETPQETTYVEFKDQLESFLNYAVYWHKKLGEA